MWPSVLHQTSRAMGTLPAPFLCWKLESPKSQLLVTLQSCPGKLHVWDCEGSQHFPLLVQLWSKGSYFFWVWVMALWKMEFGGKNQGRSMGISVLQILCPPDPSLSPSKIGHSAIHQGTSTWHKQLLFPHIILGQFFRSRPSFNIISAEMLLLLAGSVKDSLLKCFYKLYWSVLIAFYGISKFCRVIWSAMCSFGSWDIVKNNLLLEWPINFLLSMFMDSLWKGLNVHLLGKPLYF